MLSNDDGNSLASVEHNTDLLRDLLSQFEIDHQTISLSFRDLVSPKLRGPRSVHYLHHYPAKLLVHIPYFLIANNHLTQPNDLVLDPFCGSGTVMLESLLVGRNSIGIDSNPLARLISSVKTTPLLIDKLRARARKLLKRIPDQSSNYRPDVVNLDYWYPPQTVRQLSQIRIAIDQERSSRYRNFFLLCLSACARKVSLADPRVSVPVKLKEDQYPQGHGLHEKTNTLIKRLQAVNVYQVFTEILERSIMQIAELEYLVHAKCSAVVAGVDARRMKSIKHDSIDLVVTSPPYMGAQKYIRSSSLSLGWLNLASSSELIDLKRNCIGREEYRKSEYSILPETGIEPADQQLQELFDINPLRAVLAANYLLEMQNILKEIRNKIRPGGYFALVCSNNTICGVDFPTQEYLRSILLSLSLKERLRIVDTIRSRGLMTKRNKTASIISREWVLLFQRPEEEYNA